MKLSLKLFNRLFLGVVLCACTQETAEQIDLSKYFMGINGTAVFFNPAVQKYKVFNQDLSQKRSSPCSTFKIMSSYISLSENIVTPENSLRKWNKAVYWHPDWNKDMTLSEAFRVSCVWYYRQLIDEIGKQKIKPYLAEFAYGNRDVSDWGGKLNTNENNSDLRGFWIESSLQISPLEQVRFLAKLFNKKNSAVDELMKIMKVSNRPLKIYGKTGMGVKDDKITDAWFVGFYEQHRQKIFFAVRLDDAENEKVEDYRHKASQYAKQIAVDIIMNEDLF